MLGEHPFRWLNLDASPLKATKFVTPNLTTPTRTSAKHRTEQGEDGMRRSGGWSFISVRCSSFTTRGLVYPPSLLTQHVYAI